MTMIEINLTLTEEEARTLIGVLDAGVVTTKEEYFKKWPVEGWLTADFDLYKSIKRQCRDAGVEMPWETVKKDDQ